MNARRIAGMLGLCAALGLPGCGEDDQPYNERWDALIAICPQRLPSIDATCARLESSAADTAYAHALFGKAAGHRVGVSVETVVGGSAHSESEHDVPAGKRWLEGVALSRRSCDEPTCILRVTATVDGERVAHQRFEFR